MTPEGRIRATLKKRAKAAGLEHRKLGWIGRRGAPDEFLFRPQALIPRAAFVECKAPGAHPEPHQWREIHRLQDAGFDVFVVDSEATIDEVIAYLSTK